MLLAVGFFPHIINVHIALIFILYDLEHHFNFLYDYCMGFHAFDFVTFVSSG